MLDENTILSLSKRGREEQWPYPKIYKAYKEAGLEGYEVDVATHNVTFFGKGHRFNEHLHVEDLLEVASNHDADKIKAAIELNQSGKGSYPQFLKDIAAAGVVFYRVNMSTDTIHYIGRQGEDYAEHVPFVV